MNGDLGDKMQISKKEWPLLSLCGVKKRIDTQPDYQRPAVWSLSQKQLLVDTILRGYDVPKIYWRQTGKNPDTCCGTALQLAAGSHRKSVSLNLIPRGAARPS
jgi:hypothetical protein